MALLSQISQTHPFYSMLFLPFFHNLPILIKRSHLLECGVTSQRLESTLCVLLFLVQEGMLKDAF